MSLQSTLDRSSQHDPLVDLSTDDVATPPPDCCSTQVTTQRLKTLLTMSRNPERFARRLVEIMIADLVDEIFRRLVPDIQPLKHAALRCRQFHNESSLIMTGDLIGLLRMTTYLHDRALNRDLLYLGTVLTFIGDCLFTTIRPGKLDRKLFIEQVQCLCSALSRRIDKPIVNQLFVDYMFRACPNPPAGDQ